MKLGRGVSVEGRTGGERTYRWPTVPVAPRMPTLIWGRGDMGADWGGDECKWWNKWSEF